MPADRGGSVAAGRAPRPVPIHLPPAPHVQPNPDQQIQAPRPRGAPPSHTDITSSGPGYGSARANAYKQTAGYRQAVAQVFVHQPPAQKARIVQGLTRFAQANNAWHMPEFQAVRGIWDHLSTGEQNKIATYIPKDIGNFIGAHSPNVFDAAASGLRGLGGLIDMFRSKTTPGGTSHLGVYQGGIYGPGGSLGKNVTSDVVNLPAEALTSATQVGSDVVAGKIGKAAGEIVDPFIQAIKNPGKALAQHPILTPLMFTGALHGATRLGAGPVRALAPEGSAVGKALSTQREGVALTGNLTHERPPYSKSPTVKSQQVSVERSLYRRAPTGELVPNSQFLRDRLMNRGVGELVGVNERIRRVNRERAQAAREKAVKPSRTVQAAHAVKTAPAYAPQSAAIPGAAVLARIADGTIRRPDTIAEDLQKHIAQVTATRHELLDDPKALKAHDAYVKTLQTALRNKAFLRNPGRAFKAADTYARDYAPVEAAAAKLGHFGPMTSDALERRALMHAVATHMPGVRYSDELGLVAERPISGAVGQMTRLRGQEAKAAALIREPGTAGERAAAKAAIQRVHMRIKQLQTHETRPLSTDEMRHFVRQQVGNRPIAYTSDRVRFEENRGAFYVSSGRRPPPVTKSNTLYAYTHGLTKPGHDALTEQHVEMQGIVDAHKAQNRLLDTLATQKPGGGYWSTHEAAKRDAPPGYRPVNVSQPFHRQESLDKALEGVHPASLEEEAQRFSLDLRDRLQPGTKGRWALIDERALKALRQHENQIQPNALMRTARGLNNQFRTVALSTSAKHIPGVAQENIIRDIGHGVGFRSWVTGRRIIARAEEINKERGRELRTHLTGGQVAGMTEAGKVYRVSDHWAGTSVHPLLKAMEATFKAPGARQLRTAWRAWTHFAIRGTKRMLEEQHQIAGLGKTALREHGYAQAAASRGFMGLVERAFTLHGRMLDDAAKGLFDPAKARQTRAAINQMYGRWTDLAPSAQTALMFSPFGLWWVNSARFLMRMPVDMPVKTALLASTTAGTEKQRQAEGLNIGSAGALPGYEQGGIPLPGGKILAQNYYSPFGVMNNPIETGQSLLQPWLTPIVTGALGVNWLGKPLSSPGNPRGHMHATEAQKAQYILNSALSSFVPLYTKAEQILAGGASQYDVTDKGVLPAVKPPTKTKGSLAAGAAKAFLPVREYKKAAPQLSGTSSGDVYIPGGLGGSGGGGGGGGGVYIP